MSSASDKKSNFFFANCLHCEGIIRVPIAIRANSNVNCPHCSSQFELIDFMDQIPEVKVTNGHEQNGSTAVAEEFHIETDSIEKQDGKFVVPPQLAAGIRKRRRRRRRSESAGSETSPDRDPNRQLSEAEELKQERREERAQKNREKIQQQRERATVQPNRRKPSSRPPAPKRNPVLEAFKIILGGLLAAPIAYLLLMWLFAKDPLNLSPTIYNYAPILVPESLIFEESESFSPLGSNESEDSPTGLPIPETDPDDVDPLKMDLDIE